MLELWIASLRLCFIGKFSATPFQDALNGQGHFQVIWGQKTYRDVSSIPGAGGFW